MLYRYIKYIFEYVNGLHEKSILSNTIELLECDYDLLYTAKI